MFKLKSWEKVSVCKSNNDKYNWLHVGYLTANSTINNTTTTTNGITLGNDDTMSIRRAVPVVEPINQGWRMPNFTAIPKSSLFKSSPLSFYFSDHQLKSHNGIHYHYQEHRQPLVKSAFLPSTHEHVVFTAMLDPANSDCTTQVFKIPHNSCFTTLCHPQPLCLCRHTSRSSLVGSHMTIHW